MKVYVLIETREVINGIYIQAYKYIDGIFTNEEAAQAEKQKLEKEYQSTEMMHFHFDVEEHELIG